MWWHTRRNQISSSAKRTSPFKSTGATVQSTTGSWGVRINGSNAGYTMFRGSVKGTGYPLHSPVSTSLPPPCVTVWHHISTGVYYERPIMSSIYSSTWQTIPENSNIYQHRWINSKSHLFRKSSQLQIFIRGFCPTFRGYLHSFEDN